MFYLNQNTSNNVILTLTENVSLSNPVFLFHLNSHSSKKDHYFIAQDLSSATTRYNQFTIENQISGITETGWFTYKVFEQTSLINLIPQGLPLETGLCFVSGSTQMNYNSNSGGRTYNNYRK